MQLNPFKKSGTYYNGIKAKYEAVVRQVEKTNAELAKAKANQAQRTTEYQNMLNVSKRPQFNDADRELLAQLNNARSKVEELEMQLRHLNSDVAALSSTVKAPEELKKVKSEIAMLARREAELRATSAKTQAQIEKFDERITLLEERILQETQVAAQSMLESESEFVTPESLSKLDVELRIVQITQKELKAKLELLREELASIPQTQRDLRRRFISDRATVAEIDLQEALLPMMKVLARATVTNSEAGHSRSARTYEVSISSEAIEEVEAELAKEDLSS